MRDEGGELVPAEDVSRTCKKNSPSVVLCIGKWTTEGCDYGSEVGTAHNERDEKGPVPLRKSRKSGRKNSCEIKKGESSVKGHHTKELRGGVK